MASVDRHCIDAACNSKVACRRFMLRFSSLVSDHTCSLMEAGLERPRMLASAWAQAGLHAGSLLIIKSKSRIQLQSGVPLSAIILPCRDKCSLHNQCSDACFSGRPLTDSQMGYTEGQVWDFYVCSFDKLLQHALTDFTNRASQKCLGRGATSGSCCVLLSQPNLPTQYETVHRTAVAACLIQVHTQYGNPATCID